MRNWLSLLILPVVLLAGDVEIGGKLYMNYHYLTAPQAESGYNAFDLQRFYVTLKGPLTPKEAEKQVSFQITFDAKSFSDIAQKGNSDAAEANGYFLGFIKYAYVELKGFLPYTTLRFGQNPAPWVGYEEKIWGFRWVEKVMPDYAKYMSSTERGLSLHITPPPGFLDLYASVVNGEGYHKSEPNRYKDLMARVSLTPLPKNPTLKGLKLHLYYGYGVPDSGHVRNRLLGALSFKGPAYHLMGEVLLPQDGPSDSLVKGKGISVHASLDLGKLQKKGSWGLFVRYDQLDPDTEQDNDGWTLLLVGLYHQISKGFHIALDYSLKSYEDPHREAEGRVTLHTEVKF